MIKLDKQRKMATLKAEIANAYNKADDDGFDSKELKMIIKNKEKPMPLEFKRGVNNLCQLLGDQMIFDLPPIPEKKSAEKAVTIAH